jgi:hypothetical protein
LVYHSCRGNRFPHVVGTGLLMSWEQVYSCRGNRFTHVVGTGFLMSKTFVFESVKFELYPLGGEGGYDENFK